MKRLIISAIGLSCLHAAPAAAQDDPWTISGSIRARGEAIDGQFRPDAAEDDAILALRTTLFAQYDTGPVQIGGELMDSRVYFQKDDSAVGTSEVDALEPIQAYLGFNLDDALGAGSATHLTVGRFTQDIGSRRLVARANFRNDTNAFTGIRLERTNAAGDDLILFWTMPQTRLPSDREDIESNHVELDRESTDLQFFGGSFTKGGVLGGSLELYAYGLIEHDDPRYPTKNRRLFTPGIRMASKAAAGKTDYDFEAVYQMGDIRASSAPTDRRDLDVSAYFLHGEVGHSFAGAWQPRIALQYDLASGDGRGTNSYNRFDALYGARRADYGPTSLYGPVGRANLSSPGVRFEVKPDKRTDGFIAYRALWLADRTDSFGSTGVRDATGGSGSFAGQQIEARARYWLVPKKVQLDSGAAYLIKGHFLKDAPNAPDTGDTLYGYLSIEFRY